jgi:hypothetical protein
LALAARTYATVTERQLNKFDLAPNIFDVIASRPDADPPGRCMFMLAHKVEG